MNKLEIQLMLEEAADFNFLSAIEFLSSKEKEYTRSDFYKSTKIPLMVLFEKFVGYSQLKSRELELADRINEFVKAIDVVSITDIIVDFIEEAEKREPIVNLLNDLIENFNYEKLSEHSEELAKAIDKIKK